MKPRLWISTIAALAALAFAAVAGAQTNTAVSGTITDPYGVPYSGARIAIALNTPGGAVPNLTPCHNPQGNCPVNNPASTMADGTGKFLVNLWANASILPSGTTYTFTVTISPGVLPPWGTGPQTFTLANVTIAGASQSLTTAMEAVPPPALTTVPPGGSGGTPCTTIPFSLQYDNAGAFGCEPDLIFTAPHTLTLGPNGVLVLGATAGTPQIDTIDNVADGDYFNRQATILGPFISVPNGDFEDGGPFAAGSTILPPPGWSPNAEGTLSYDSTTPYEGNYSLIVTSDATGLGAATSNTFFPASPGQSFTISAYVHGDGTHAGQISIRFANAAASEIGSVSANSTSSTSWQYVTATGTAPAGSVIGTIFLSLASTGAAGSAEFDLVSANSNPAGDVSGSYFANVVTGWHFGTTELPLSTTPPTTGQTFCWNGTQVIGCSNGSGGGPYSVTTSTVSSTVTIGTSATTVATVSVTMPSSGCPCYAQVGYALNLDFSTSIQAVAFHVSDGSAVMTGTQAAPSNGSAGGYTPASATMWSPSNYSNGQNVTFTLSGIATASGTNVNGAPLVGTGPNSQLQVAIFTQGGGGGGGGGTVTQVTFPTIPSWLTAAVATNTTTPAISVTPTPSQASHQVIGTCGSATTFGPCSLTAADLPQIPLSQLNGGSAPTGQSYNFGGVTLLQLRFSSGLTTSANGDFGYDTASGNWHGWNGADSIFVPLAAGFVSGDCPVPTSTGGKWTLVDFGGPCGSASLPSGVLGQQLANNGSGAQAYSAVSPSLGIGNGGAPVSLASANYPIGCDSATVSVGITDRLTRIAVGTAGSFDVVIPDLSGTGCSGMTGEIDNNTGSSITIARQTSDTFNVYGPNASAPSTGVTSFSLPAYARARYAPDTSPATYRLDVVNPPASGGVADITITTGTTAIAANSCTTNTATTMSGVATTMTFAFTPNASTVSVTGWGSTGGLVIAAYPTSNTVNWSVCNQTASSITPGASVTWNVSAR